MEYLEKKRREQVRQTAEDRIAYRELLGKLATEMKLGPKDETRLDGILSRLAIQLDSVERDVAILRDHARLTTAVLPRAEVVAELAAIAKISDDYRDRETKALAALAADAQVINSRLSLANDRLRVADKAAEELQKLQLVSWELLGQADPAIESRTRQLQQVIFGRPTNPPHEVVEFENLMKNPGEFAAMLRPDSTTIWVAPAGQSPVEFQRLMTAARKIANDGRPARYVLHIEDVEKVVCCKDQFEIFDPAHRPKLENRIYVDTYQWPTAPGQTEAQRDEYVGKITRREQLQNNNVTSVLLREPNKSAWATIAQA